MGISVRKEEPFFDSNIDGREDGSSAGGDGGVLSIAGSSAFLEPECSEGGGGGVGDEKEFG